MAELLFDTVQCFNEEKRSVDKTTTILSLYFILTQIFSGGVEKTLIQLTVFMPISCLMVSCF